MWWDGVLPHSPKSLSIRAFDHPQPIGRKRLLTCLLHVSLRVKSIMVPVVSQMLTKDLNTLRGLNISDPHHLAAIFHLRGHLNTSLSPTPPKILNFGGPFQLTPIFRNLGGLSKRLHFSSNPQQYSISRNLGGLSSHLHFSYHPQHYSISRGLPAIVSIINLSSCLCVASEKHSWGDHSICGPWPRHSNPVIVELGTLFAIPALASNLHGFSKWYICILKKQLTPSSRSARHDQPEWGATGHHSAPRHCPPNPIVNRFFKVQFSSKLVSLVSCFPTSWIALFTTPRCLISKRRRGATYPWGHDTTKRRSAKNN